AVQVPTAHASSEKPGCSGVTSQPVPRIIGINVTSRGSTVLPDLIRADTRHESRLTMRRILAKHDKGPDVALIQELLNRMLPFEGPFRAPRDVPSLWT